jgi:hypothetical protein
MTTTAIPTTTTTPCDPCDGTPCILEFDGPSDTTVQYIESPGYGDGNYANELNCEWTLRTTSGKVKITVEEFKLQGKVGSGKRASCKDYLQLKDITGGNVKQCGAKFKSPNRTSKEQSITAKFVTNKLKNNKGFRASVRTVSS